VPARGRAALYLCDVDDDGPAGRLGLEDGDELQFIGGADGKVSTRVDSLRAYLDAFPRCVQPNAAVKVRVLKHNSVSAKPLDLLVGPLPGPPPGVPEAPTADRLAALTRDPAALAQCCAAVIGAHMDTLRCGVVGVADFIDGLRRWLPRDTAALLPDDVCRAAWARYDPLDGGCLTAPTVRSLLAALLRLVAAFALTTKKETFALQRQKHPTPVDTHALYEQWRDHGWLSGTFSEAQRDWQRVMCEGTHHLLVSVEDGLIIRFGDTTEQLAPGDEVFVPAGHTYDVMARSSCRYVFGVQHRLLPSVPLSFLEETWGPPAGRPPGPGSALDGLRRRAAEVPNVLGAAGRAPLRPRGPRRPPGR